MNIGKYMMSEIPLATGATAVYPYSYGLERKFRFMTRFGDTVEMFKRDGNIIHLPRAVCPIGDNDNRLKGKPVVFPKCPTPREHQKKMFAEVAGFVGEELSGIAVAQTGFGKTILGFLAAYRLQVKTLVITTKEDIFLEWVKGAKEFLGCKPWEVGEIRGDKCEVIDTTFCVALVQSLSKEGKYPDWIGDDFGLIIFDECHRMPAEQFSTVIPMFRAKVRLGLSATIDRKDGKELLLYTHIGPVRAEYKANDIVPKVLRYMSGWEVPRRWSEDPKDPTKKVLRQIPHQPGKTAHLEGIMTKSATRNQMLVDMINQSLQADRSTVIFSTQIEHLQLLERACNELHGIPYKHMGIYKSESTKAEKADREAIKVKPIIFTTFSMMAEGTNIPWLDTCLLAMPRSDVRQPVGRIRREYEDKKFPVVMDVMDLDSPVFYGYANKRRDWYVSIGAEIVEMS